MKESYNNDVTDEFIVPFVVTDEHGRPTGVIRDDDVCIMFNYRADRARQITRVLARNSGLAADGGKGLIACGGTGRGRFRAARFRRTCTTCA